ncbi:MAG: hypothetical protein GX787_06720 [Tissierellia bacterium]|nr:hypothetical protein [Tissierellia bacterium]
MNMELIENNLEKLDSVISCKIILGENDIVDEIHIVSNGKINPKQLSRNIQSILIATHNLNIDYKKISIAQITDKTLGKVENRLKIKGLSFNNEGSKASVKVALKNSADTYETSLMGINSVRNIERMLVDATLKNIEEALGYEDTFILEDVRTIPVSSEKAVVVVVMCMVEDMEQKLCGSCLVKTDYKEAIVKATLDAVNRYTTK